MTAPALTDCVLADIKAERETHPEKGYDADHDRVMSVHHLVTWAERYTHKEGKGPNAEPGYYDRHRLVQAASLLVAAIETLDRMES